MGFDMVRISAIFIAVCMVLIAGSVGFVVYNAVAARSRDRAEVSDQIAAISRSSSDLARQLAEFGRQLGTVETKVDSVLDKALASAQPLAVEIEELSTLVKHLADSVAAHDAVLAGLSGKERIAPAAPASAPAMAAHVTAAVPRSDPAAAPAAPTVATIAAFNGLDQAGIVAVIKNAIDGSKIDLYLQPIVTLPQRKVRYYEALSRLK